MSVQKKKQKRAMFSKKNISWMPMPLLNIKISLLTRKAFDVLLHEEFCIGTNEMQQVLMVEYMSCRDYKLHQLIYNTNQSWQEKRLNNQKIDDHD